MKTYAYSAYEMLHRLENEYRKRYAGSEGHPLWRPTEESTVRIAVRIEVPEMLAVEDLENCLETVLKRHILDMIHEIGRLSDRIANGLSDKR